MSGARPLLNAARAIAVLGLASLTFTGEIGTGYLVSAWLLFASSFFLDSQQEWQQRVRRGETAAVLVLITTFIIDFGFLHQTVFVAVTHFLILFQNFKFLGLKERRDCLQIVLFGFFQILAACTLSVDAWHALVLLLLIPIGAAALYWQQVEQEDENSRTHFEREAGRAYRRLAFWIAAGALPVD